MIKRYYKLWNNPSLFLEKIFRDITFSDVTIIWIKLKVIVNYLPLSFFLTLPPTNQWTVNNLFMLLNVCVHIHMHRRQRVPVCPCVCAYCVLLLSSDKIWITTTSSGGDTFLIEKSKGDKECTSSFLRCRH